MFLIGVVNKDLSVIRVFMLSEFLGVFLFSFLLNVFNGSVREGAGETRVVHIMPA